MPVKKSRRPATKKRVAKKSAPRRAPRRARRAPRTLLKSVQGRAGQVTLTSSSHKHIASAEVRRAKAMSTVNIISGSQGFSLEIQSGTQNQIAFPQCSSALMADVLNKVEASSVQDGVCRAVITGVKVEYILTNSTNMPVEMDIYDIVCKRDLVAPNLSFFNQATGYTYTATNSPDAYWQTGLNAQQGFDPAAPIDPQPNNMLTAVPTDSKLFNDYFSIRKKTRVMMAAAAAHKHSVNINVNKYIDEYLTNTTIGALKGYTTFSMFVVAGFPVIKSDTGVTTTNAAALNVVKSERIKFKWVADNAFTSTFSTNLPINSGLTQQLCIRPITGDAGVVNTEPPV